MPPKILVVEDYPDLGDLLCQILQRGGMAPSLSPSGADAVKMAASLKPDAVLLDLMLPDISGLEVCCQLKGNAVTANIPVLFVTCAENENCFRDCYRFGAYDVLRKPYNPQHVIQTVFAAMEWTRSQKMAPASGEFQLDASDPKMAARGIEEMFHRMSQSPRLFARLHEPMVKALGSFFYPQDIAAAGIPSHLNVAYQIVPDNQQDEAEFKLHFHWTPGEAPAGRSWFNFRKKEDLAPAWLKDMVRALGARFESVENGDVDILCDGTPDPITGGGLLPPSIPANNISHT